MKIKNYQTQETIGTFSWILMDFCWMSKMSAFAWFFGILAIISSFSALLLYKDNKKGEKLLLAASWIWVMMNTCWMVGEDLNLLWLLIVAKIYFLMSIIMIIFAAVISKKEENILDFKRLKIK